MAELKNPSAKRMRARDVAELIAGALSAANLVKYSNEFDAALDREGLPVLGYMVSDPTSATSKRLFRILIEEV